MKLTKFNLRLASVGMVIAAVGVVTTSIFLPVGSPFSQSTQLAIRSLSAMPATTQSSDNEINFTDVMDVELDRPLVDARPATATPRPGNDDSTNGLRLIGTIIEPPHNYAVFSDTAGKTEIKSAGDKAGGASLTAINPDSVTLQINGRTMVLHVVRPPEIGVAGR